MNQRNYSKEEYYLKDNPAYTTGQASKILYISSRKTATLLDNGKLKGFKIPGSKHRRILHNSLVDFIFEQENPEFFLEKLKDYQNEHMRLSDP